MPIGNGAARTKDDSKLLIKWDDANGASITECTQTNDISENGISFFLKSPIWLDTHLTITIASSELFGHLHKVTGKVVRIQTDPAGKQLIGVRFD